METNRGLSGRGSTNAMMKIAKMTWKAMGTRQEALPGVK